MKTRALVFAASLPVFALLWTAAAEEATSTPSATPQPAATVAPQPVSITPTEAKDNIGKIATVTGKVVSAVYLERSKSKITLLNLDQAHPDEIFTVVIPSEIRAKFTDAPEKALLEKVIAVTGKITDHKGTPQIQVTDPEQIKVTEEPATPAAEKPAEAA